MKRIFAAMLLGAGLAVTVNAALAQSGDPGGPPPAGEGRGWHGQPDPAQQAAHLAKRLGLSADQQTQVTAILTDTHAQMKALDENQSITRKQFQEQAKALHESSQTKIEAVLNDQQKKEFAEMRERREHGRGRGPDGEGPPPPPQ